LKAFESIGQIGKVPSPEKASAPLKTSSIIAEIGSRLISYIQLTKPSVMILVAFTGAAALLIEGSLVGHPWKFVLFLAGLYMTGGAANSFNQYFERDVDARMARTCLKRPIPSGRISPNEALWFSIFLGIWGAAVLTIFFNWQTGMLSVGTILFYSLFYTLYLKPSTSYNIVIGGIAGAMAPVGAWMAATGGTTVIPWLMFLIIFLWTPPHFWTLALCYREDYRAVGYPMLPNIMGEAATIKRIEYYLAALILSSLIPIMTGFGSAYIAAAVVLDCAFIVVIWRVKRAGGNRSYRSMFKFSIFYLFTLFAAMTADKLL